MTKFVCTLQTVGALRSGFTARDWTNGTAIRADRALTGTC